MPDRYTYLKMGNVILIMLCLGIKLIPDYTIWNNNSNQAITNSKNRISINPNFQLIEENANGLIVEVKRMCIA
jgi:carboxyl-terminal processing protease